MTLPDTSSNGKPVSGQPNEHKGSGKTGQPSKNPENSSDVRGYVRLAEKTSPASRVKPTPVPRRSGPLKVPPRTYPPKTGGYFMVVSYGRGDGVTPGPRLVGRMILRGFLLQEERPSHPTGTRSRTSPIQRSRTQATVERPILKREPLPETTGEVQPDLRTIQSGKFFRIISPVLRNLMVPKLAEALETVFNQFSQQYGFSEEKPLTIELARGYEEGDRGHGQGLAADLGAVGGRSFLDWKRDSQRALAQSRKIKELEKRRAFLHQMHQNNLGYQLYRSLVDFGGWRVFNGVVQLFGPWTDTLGPWRRLRAEMPAAKELAMVAEQERIFKAHMDHIHVARG